MKSYEIPVDDDVRKVATNSGARSEIHVGDPDYQTLAQGVEVSAASQLYYESGRNQALRIRDLVVRHQGAVMADGAVTSPMSMLVIGARFGHLTRHLQALFPQAKIVALVFEEPEMYFHQNDLSIEAALSVADPNLAKAFFQFDVVVAPTFFGHVHKSVLAPWVSKAMEFSARNGLTIANFQGPLALGLRFPKRVFDKDGTTSPVHVPSRQPGGLAFAETLAKPNCVFELFDKAGARVVEFQEGYWDGVRDLYIARKVK